jgi:hypothetical protein
MLHKKRGHCESMAILLAILWLDEENTKTKNVLSKVKTSGI